ncbi:MAG TPA: DNA-formamidopyrimidine glycosylase family protein [Vicinamibacterales bacterium]|nr:DNA-formamidopyrimidine glycosylase family protein [Vicinamibacterales bacterium]
MPEGDTIFRAARTLNRALAGRAVTRFDSVYPALTRVDHDAPLAGRIVEHVVSRGKHLLIAFTGDLILHTHMRMSGSWHIYRNGERWRAPAHEMRVLIGTDAYVAVAFAVPVAEFLTSEQLARHPDIQALGPDLADPAVDLVEVRRRMAAHAAEPLHEVLLNQRVIAGIGNVLKSEVLFVARLDPFAAAGSLTDDAFERLMKSAIRLMQMNVIESVRMTPVTGRRTTGSLDPGAKLFVYGRGGRPCRACGTPIEARKSGFDARLTYWCPRCQCTAPSRTGDRA